MNKKLLFTLCAYLIRATLGTGDLLCRVKMVDVDYGSNATTNNDIFYFCETTPEEELDGADGIVYHIDFPASFLEENSLLMEGPDIFILVSDARGVREHDNVGAYVEYSANSTITILTDEDLHHFHLQHRQLSHNTPAKRTIGVSNLLVLRVSSPDSNNTLSKEIIHGRIFGVGEQTQEVNVVDQIDRCSYSKLTLVPAKGPLISHGVGDLMLNFNAVGTGASDLENRLKTATEQKFGTIQGNFDHVLYCLPPGLRYDENQEKWLAFAVLNSWISVYNDEWCVNLSAVIHELGHNWNLAHSGESAAAYGDTTGYMGSASYDVGGPAQCFNGNKNWFLGWYADKAVEIPWDQPWGGYIYAFTDYENVPDDGYVLLKVGRLYLQYNRAESFNIGVRERRNQVTVVYNPDRRASSYLGGGIGVGWAASKSIQYANYEWSGYPLVFEACENVYGPADYVRISIHLGGLHESTCNQNLFSDAPTNAPTAPSSFPSLMPSLPPSMTNSLMPSTQPTESPTVITVQPSTSQTPSSHCEDQKAHFWIDEETKTEKMSCYKLAVNQTMIDQVCHEGHSAYDLCEDTCGKCHDKCNDSPGIFMVNKKYGYQNCNWLIGKPGFQLALCKPGKVAFTMCGETCNTCDVGGPTTPVPSVAPGASLAPSEWCEDTDGTFYVNIRKMGNKDCTWLSRSQAWQNLLCVPSHAAFQVCPELCGACADDCDDDTGTFFVNNGHGYQNCNWLSIRPNIAKRICVPTHPAYEMCGETCDSCRRRN